MAVPGVLAPAPIAADQARWNGSLRRVAVASWTVLAVGLSVAASRSVSAPFWLTVTLLLAGAAAIVARPRVGVYLCVGLGLVADNRLAPWYPFAKNASSRESIFFLDDAVGLSPLELFLLLTTGMWLLSLIVERRPIERGSLFVPLAAFTGFVAIGFVNGMAGGGDRIVALWEVRPLLYLPLVYLLATNLLTERRHYVRLFAVIIGALLVESLYGVHHLLTTTEGAVTGPEGWSPVEHSAALHMNTLVVLALALRVFDSGATALRTLLPWFAVPVLVLYVNSERRSAFVALAAAMMVLAAMLFFRRRRLFWAVVPAATLLFGLYVAAFWNQQSSFAYPAQSVKSILAPDQVSAEDQSSTQYREIETYDLVTTIRSAPVLGIGFGQEFLRPVPLPDLSFVPFWEYIPHNSVLWIWLKAGVGGILAFLYLVGAATSRGLATARRTACGTDAAIVTTAALLFPMFAIYAYVDIAWDAQTALYLGVAAATVAHFERVLPAATSPGGDR